MVIEKYTNPQRGYATLTPERMRLELLAMQPLLSQYPIEYVAWHAQGSLPEISRRTVLRVHLYGIFEGTLSPEPFVFEVIPSIDHPADEPAAVILNIDPYQIAAALGCDENPHVYNAMDKKLLCVHLGSRQGSSDGWEPGISTLSHYVTSALVGWTNNFTGFIATEGRWKPRYWAIQGRAA
jgi:hypothetical protein